MKYSRASFSPPKCCPHAVQITNSSDPKMPSQNGHKPFERLKQQNPRKKQITTAVRCFSVAVDNPSSIERTVATTCHTHQASKITTSKPDLLAAGHRAVASPRSVTTARPA